MNDIALLIIAGLSSGSIYGIIALAFTLIYNSTKIVNFAQGSLLMSGAMFSYYFLEYKQMPVVLAVVLVIVATSLLGLLLKTLIVDPLHKKKAELFNIIIATLAVSIVLEQLFSIFMGKRQFRVPSLIEGDPIKLGGNVMVFPETIILIVVTAFCVFCFWFLLNKTALGRAIQAIGFNREAAKLAGLKTSKLIAITFMLSAAISGIGGLIVSPIMGASPYMGVALGVKGFAACILGGMGNPFAGFVGGVIIGLAESFSSFYISSTYSPVFSYLILLVMLIVKPSGLWPEKGGD
ncbi:MAG: branched-chain amino acid ABC transporter permease [Sphaerochaeta sp.]|nr:branched-chain amino acid ABC transporter permease [Sphaerochaeta sp.]